MTYVLGLTSLEESCPVCDVKPQMFRESGLEDLVECGRCGLPSMIDTSRGDGRRLAVPAASIAMLPVFRKFWQETGCKITFPELVGDDVLLAGRLVTFDKWCRENPEVVSQANLAVAAPYTSITAVCIIVEGADGKTQKGWHLLVPAEGQGAGIGLPFSAEAFLPGTIVVIQTPTMTKVEEPEPPRGAAV